MNYNLFFYTLNQHVRSLFLFYQPSISINNLVLSDDESRHAIRVLRLGVGAEIRITDGSGKIYTAKITDPDPRKCAFEILSVSEETLRPYRIHIAIAPTKNIDRTEWFVEKAVEIGIDEITFMKCSKSERRSVNLERFEKLTISAMKQSQRTWLPSINPIIPFQNVLKFNATRKFIAHVDPINDIFLKSAARQNENYLVLIGPEGDFSSAEVDQAVQSNFQKVSLGAARLRTETAALTACLTLNLINQ